MTTDIDGVMEQFRELTGFWPHDETLYMFLASFLVMVVAKLVLEQLVLPLARLPASAYKQSAGDGSVLVLDPNLSFFTIHFLANAAVCWLALEDTLYYLSHPLTHRPSENVGHAIVMAVHIFHALMYKLSKADLIHHGVSVGLVYASFTRIGSSNVEDTAGITITIALVSVH